MNVFKKFFKTISLLIVYFGLVFLVGCYEGNVENRLATPTGVTTVVSENTAYVFFNPVENADSYYVYVYDDRGIDLISQLYVKDLTMLVSGVELYLPDGTYKICVEALDSKGTYNKSIKTNFYDVTTPVEGDDPTPIVPPIDEDTYTITYILNGGNLETTKNSYKKGDTIVLDAPTKDNATFEGWFKESNFATEVKVISKNDSGNIILYAKWKTNSDTPPVDYESYYKSAQGLLAAALKKELRSIISSNVKKLTYDNLKTYLPITDADPNDSTKMLLLFSHEKVKAKWDGAATWNREHVWPQSKSWFTTSGAGADIQHIRPEDPTVNGIHGNLAYGVVTNGKAVTYNGKTVAKVGSYFEPNDDFKGDVARIVFYLLVRYSESDTYNITNVAQSMKMLLEWNELDPVDDFEILRNERSYQIQKNRNPFIDHPEFANLIWK